MMQASITEAIRLSCFDPSICLGISTNEGWLLSSRLVGLSFALCSLRSGRVEEFPSTNCHIEGYLLRKLECILNDYTWHCVRWNNACVSE